ncbi:MAG: pyrroline-5-carboxylate reductase, partial [Planctomycetaceae bacterium]
MSRLMPATLKIGFIGAGKMATALAKGWCRAEITVAGSIRASDVIPMARKQFTAETSACCGNSNVDVARFADVLVLAVKPQQFRSILAELAPVVTSQQLVVSIAAGIPLDALLAQLGRERRVVRVMPNTPCLVGESASAYCLAGTATAADEELIQRLLAAVGLAFKLPESLLDAVTGLSGSGPAFACLMIEALADGGVKAGLPRDVAQQLAAQTLLGTARMVLETKQHPGALKDAVASPGGTTIAGL